jgi:hypothetical protein
MGSRGWPSAGRGSGRGVAMAGLYMGPAPWFPLTRGRKKRHARQGPKSPRGSPSREVEKSDTPGRAPNRPVAASVGRGVPGVQGRGGLGPPGASQPGSGQQGQGGSPARRAVLDLGGAQLAAVPDGTAVLALQPVTAVRVVLFEPLAPAGTAARAPVSSSEPHAGSCGRRPVKSNGCRRFRRS